MKKLAIIGASYLQQPLIQKAKSMGLETHVFAWRTGDVGEKSADFFYDISIVEKEEILRKCLEIGIDGICSIASDLAVITVNYVAYHMGLIGNSLETTLISTNKNMMRKAFDEGGVPSPKSILVERLEDLDGIKIEYPIIVKPIDRSGSRGITKLNDEKNLQNAIENAKECGFIKKALVEEYVGGQEYSVECLSWKGEHRLLAITKKYTTGAPHFIETGHLEPANIDDTLRDKMYSVVSGGLDSLGIQYGASHSELKVREDGVIKVIEIGGRMGGDFIGSELVRLSTGYDYVKAVVDIALGSEPEYNKICTKNVAAVRFVFSQNDIEIFEKIKKDNPELLVDYHIEYNLEGEVKDSSSRFGYYIISGSELADIIKYLPE